MTKLIDLPSRHPKVIIYGPVKIGKTALALTLGEDALMIDFEDGLLTGQTLEDEHQQARGQVEVVQFLDLDRSKATAFTKAKAHALELANKYNRGETPFKAVIVDSLTSMAEASVNGVLATGDHLGKNPQIQEWGLAFTDIKNYLSIIRSMPVVFILTAHEAVKTVGKGTSAEDKTVVAIPGKNLPAQVGQLFDELWYMRARAVGAGKSEFYLQTVQTSAALAGSRGNLANNTKVDAGLWKLIEQLKKRKEGEAVVTKTGQPVITFT